MLLLHIINNSFFVRLSYFIKELNYKLTFVYMDGFLAVEIEITNVGFVLVALKIVLDIKCCTNTPFIAHLSFE